MKKEHVPSLRFKGFSEEWEESLLGDSAFIQRGGSPRPIEQFITDSENGINWIKIGDVATDSRYIYATREKIILEGVKYSRVVKSGDLILSNSMSFGRPYIVKIEACIHDGWLLIQDKDKKFYVEFLVQLLSSESMYKQYRTLASGGVVNNLNKDLVQSTTVSFPLPPEQTKIGNYFKELDELINLNQAKYDKLQNIKKALLEKIFPKANSLVPQLRFKGFSEEWEEDLLENLGTYNKGNGYSKADLKDLGSPIILYGRLYINHEIVIKEVSTFVHHKNGAVWSNGNEVIVPASGETADDIARASVVLNAGIVIGGDLNIIVPNKKIDSTFLALSISHGVLKKELSKKAQGKSVVHIRNKDIQSCFLKFPHSTEQKNTEQTKIGNLFQKLDKLINLQESKIKKLQSIKKACLVKMFV